MNMNRWFKTQTAQGVVEYALIIAIVAIGVVLVLRSTGGSVEAAYCKALGGITGEGCGCEFTFDNGSELESWEGNNPNGYFSIEDGQACLTGDGTARSFLNNCSGTSESDNFSVAVENVALEKAGNGNIGFDIWFRAQDEDNGYHFTYNATAHVIRFWKQVNGKWIRLASKSSPKAWASETLNFKVVINGDVFTAYKDDVEILQASDDTFKFEKVGLRNKPGSKTCLDSMVVETMH